MLHHEEISGLCLGLQKTVVCGGPAATHWQSAWSPKQRQTDTAVTDRRDRSSSRETCIGDMGNLSTAGHNRLQTILRYELSGNTRELQIELHHFGCLLYSVYII